MERWACRLPRFRQGLWRRRGTSTLVLTTVVALAASGGGQAAGDRAIPGGGLAHTDVVTISSTPVGKAVPGAFIGVSLEYGVVSSAERPGRKGVDQVLAQLIRNLSPGHAALVRIGGESGDKSWWPVPGIRRPRGVNFALTPAWLVDARELAQSADARLILGINLEANSAAIASTEARHLLNGIGRRHIEALEIGNEPELYAGIPWFRTATGQKGFGRPPSYNLADYMKEFTKIAGALPPFPLAGPSTGSDSWIAGLGQMITANPRLRLATFHSYALDPLGSAFRGHDCSTAIGEVAHPSVPALLDSYASQSEVQEALPYVAVAHSHGIPFRIDEMNAITCAGVAGVSDTSASALWVLNELFQLASDRIDGVNIHTWKGSAGKLFNMQYQHGRWVGTIQPEYYGMLMFTQAAPPGSRLLSTGRADVGPLRSWAVRAPDHSVRVVLINDSLKHTRWVLVRPPHAGRHADVERLKAPSAYATQGVTLGGQSFGAQTATGRLAGPRTITRLRPSGGGYTVQVPAASAVMLTIR